MSDKDRHQRIKETLDDLKKYPLKWRYVDKDGNETDSGEITIPLETMPVMSIYENEEGNTVFEGHIYFEINTEELPPDSIIEFDTDKNDVWDRNELNKSNDE